MQFKEGDRTILGPERFYSDYDGDPKIPHAENYIDIEPMGSKTLKIRAGREPNDTGGEVILYGITSIVINGRRIEWNGKKKIQM